MYGSILSVLLMGVIPVWGASHDAALPIAAVRVSPPVLSADVAALSDIGEQLTAEAISVVDMESGQTVFRKEADVSRPMASLTKLMTALLIVEHHELTEAVTVPSDIGSVIGNKANLPPGEQFTVGDLLSATLIMSANDAAVTLAEFHSGSVEAFVEDMNERAIELGLRDTSYENPAGLDAPAQKSSPRDLTWLAMYVMRHPAIADRMSTKEEVISTLSGKTITLVHTHQILRSNQSSLQAVVRAGKTGTTDGAGECLLSIIEANGRQYIAVLLHSTDRYADMEQLLRILSQ